MACLVTYEPERGELTGLVRMPNTAWDQADTWWLDCLVTYETDPPRPEGLVLPVVLHDPGVSVLVAAARILEGLCVVAAIVCHVRPPLDRAAIMALQEVNAALEARKLRLGRALVTLRAAMEAVHVQRRRRCALPPAASAPAAVPAPAARHKQLNLVMA